MPASAFHDKTYGSIERGNVLGDRSSVRQSRYFRQYESGNAVKSILGTDNLRWDVDRKEGVFQGHAVYDGSRQEYDNEAAARAAADQQTDRQPQTYAPVQPAATQQPSRKQLGVGSGRSTMSTTDDALWNAVGSRDLAEVQRLLRQGANPNMICPDGWVKDECRPKDGSVGRSLLHHAAWAGDLNIFKLLVAHGADVESRRNTAWRPHGGVRGRGSTCLHHAVMYNRRPVVEFLLDECGCDLNQPGEQGYTPLHLAAKFNLPQLVELLLRRGARTDMLTKDEKTARDLAAPKQERSHMQMDGMLELFDRYDAEARNRPRLLPGAPLPPDPRLPTHAANGTIARPIWLTSEAAMPPAPGAQYTMPPAAQYMSPMPPMPPAQLPPTRYDRDAAAIAIGFVARQPGLSHERGRLPASAPVVLAAVRHSPAAVAPPPVYLGGSGGGTSQRPPSESAIQSEMRPDQISDAAAAATRRRAQGSRPW